MKRRQVLATATVLLPLGGCLGPDGNGPDETTTPDNTTTTPAGTDENGYRGASLEMANAECASEDATAASVAFGETDIVVEGTIVGNDACYMATLDAVVYDDAANQLSIVVESVSDAAEGEMCAQCITAIDYEVTVRFSDGGPERVEVSHRRGGEVKKVAAEQRA
jgi:hypothetical protein